MADIVWLKKVWSTGPAYVNDRAVLLVLVDVMHNDSHRAWPSVETIAKRVGISTRSVRTRLRALEDAGWITTEELGGGRHRSTTYVVNVGQFDSEKPGRNPEAVARNPEAVARNPEAASAYRLEGLKNQGTRARPDAVDHPMPGVVTTAPLPCPKHPNGWRHRDPCGRCASLREYDEQQRSAVHELRDRTPDEMCGGCDYGWIDHGPHGVEPCPNGCLTRVPDVGDTRRKPHTEHRATGELERLKASFGSTG